MPLVPLFLSEEQIIYIHETLIEIYREEEQPIKIESGYNFQSLIGNICYRGL